VDVLTWAQIPSGKAVLEYQIFGCLLGVEFGEGVGAIQAEPSDNENVVAQVCGDTGEHESLGAGARKGVTLPTHSGRRTLTASAARQDQASQVGETPGRAAMVVWAASINPSGVHIDHMCPRTANSASTRPGPQPASNTRPAREHRIERPSPPAKIRPFGSHRAGPFDRPLGITGAASPDPTRQLTCPITAAGHLARGQLVISG
jgi:hypothetical protein